MDNTSVGSKLTDELQSFQSIWDGGYYEGNPLDPMTYSSYNEIGYMSVLRATYLACIKPYVTKETIGLEIGPGRGCWTKCMLNAKQLWCLDALSAEHNKFWEYIGPAKNVNYFQVHDFKCEMLPKDTIDFVFSFGCLCHVSVEGITAYMTNLFPILKSGARGFIMVADYKKYNNVVKNIDAFSAYRAVPVPTSRLIRYFLRSQRDEYRKISPSVVKDKDPDDSPSPGRWYDAGTDNTCAMLEQIGYTIIDRDMEVNHRDPVIHFMKK